MNVTSIAVHELGEHELRLWRGLLAADDRFRSPFLTPRFAQVMGAHQPGSRVAVLDDAGRSVGLLPYSRSSERVALPLGEPMNDAQALLAPRDLDYDPRRLVRELGVRDWRFNHLLPDQPRLAGFAQSWHPSPTIDLTDGLDAYRADVGKRSSSVLKRTASRRRQIDREIGPVTVESRSTDAALLDTLIRWKSWQYQRTNVRDLFTASWPRAVLHELHETADQECEGVLSVLRAGDHVVALDFNLRRTDVLHSWFGAYNPEFSKYSPGLVLLLENANTAPEHGIRVIDLGRGYQDYKRRISNATYHVGEGQVPALGRSYRAALLARHPGWIVRRAQSLRRTKTTNGSPPS
jgi:CelD/BcsL family acetyltransferase involved in cellulose biosynthesis